MSFYNKFLFHSNTAKLKKKRKMKLLIFNLSKAIKIKEHSHKMQAERTGWIFVFKLILEL